MRLRSKHAPASCAVKTNPKNKKVCSGKTATRFRSTPTPSSRAISPYRLWSTPHNALLVAGASAPDHMHFQAGLRKELPICDELFAANIRLFDANNQGIFGAVTSLGRPVFYIETMSTALGEMWFDSLLNELPVKNGHVEPMVNILCWHNNGSWCIAVFPRRKHRPACYGTGEDQFVLSPASVDMGGLWAVAREEDYKNLTLHDVTIIYMDVCQSPQVVDEISEKLLQYYYSKKQ